MNLGLPTIGWAAVRRLGSGVQGSTTTSGPSNSAVNGLVTNLSTGLNNVYKSTPNLYVGPGQTTQQGWSQALNAANNPDYASGIAGALKSYGNIAAGNAYGTNDPGYATLRQNAIDDTLAATNKSFLGSGLFGSDSNQKAAGEGVANAIAGLDYGNFQNDQARQASAAALLPQLLQGAQAPSSIYGSVGNAQDAAAQAKAYGPLTTIGQIVGNATGLAGASPQSSSTSTPLWQVLAGLL